LQPVYAKVDGNTIFVSDWERHDVQGLDATTPPNTGVPPSKQPSSAPVAQVDDNTSQPTATPTATTSLSALGRLMWQECRIPAILQCYCCFLDLIVFTREENDIDVWNLIVDHWICRIASLRLEALRVDHAHMMRLVPVCSMVYQASLQVG
jgi:hypothetical protein